MHRSLMPICLFYYHVNIKKSVHTSNVKCKFKLVRLIPCMLIFYFAGYETLKIIFRYAFAGLCLSYIPIETKKIQSTFHSIHSMVQCKAQQFLVGYSFIFLDDENFLLFKIKLLLVCLLTCSSLDPFQQKFAIKYFIAKELHIPNNGNVRLN